MQEVPFTSVHDVIPSDIICFLRESQNKYTVLYTRAESVATCVFLQRGH